MNFENGRNLEQKYYDIFFQFGGCQVLLRGGKLNPQGAAIKIGPPRNLSPHKQNKDQNLKL